jgi:pimeloyl-ACP methyl ester carboxylesterase
MGGMTVMSLAAHHRSVLAERARALVLVSTAAFGLSQGGRGDAFAGRMVGSSLVERVMRGAVGHALVRGAVGRSVRRNHLMITRDLFVACSPAARTGWLTAMQAMDLRAGLVGVAVPTTVVVGSVDRLTPPPLAAELVDRIAGAGLVTLDGFGHMLPLEAPDEIASVIADAAATRVAAPIAN